MIQRYIGTLALLILTAPLLGQSRHEEEFDRIERLARLNDGHAAKVINRAYEVRSRLDGPDRNVVPALESFVRHTRRLNVAARSRDTGLVLSTLDQLNRDARFLDKHLYTNRAFDKVESHWNRATRNLRRLNVDAGALEELRGPRERSERGPERLEPRHEDDEPMQVYDAGASGGHEKKGRKHDHP